MILLSTSALSASYGIALGDTKEVASTTWSPLNESRLISSTLQSVGTKFFSFCKPSRGDTSTIFTLVGNCFPIRCVYVFSRLTTWLYTFII